jgi:hypothetical protein
MLRVAGTRRGKYAYGPVTGLAETTVGKFDWPLMDRRQIPRLGRASSGPRPPARRSPDARAWMGGGSRRLLQVSACGPPQAALALPARSGDFPRELPRQRSGRNPP